MATLIFAEVVQNARWEAKASNHLEYHISVSGQEGSTRYLISRRDPRRGDVLNPIGAQLDLEAAKQICERDYIARAIM